MKETKKLKCVNCVNNTKDSYSNNTCHFSYLPKSTKKSLKYIEKKETGNKKFVLKKVLNKREKNC